MTGRARARPRGRARGQETGPPGALSSFSVECGVCFAYRLESDSAVPDQVCNHCGQPFHQACLYEWLRGLPESRLSFNMLFGCCCLFGECPFCRRTITVKATTQKA